MLSNSVVHIGIQYFNRIESISYVPGREFGACKTVYGTNSFVKTITCILYIYPNFKHIVINSFVDVLTYSQWNYCCRRKMAFRHCKKVVDLEWFLSRAWMVCLGGKQKYCWFWYLSNIADRCRDLTGLEHNSIQIAAVTNIMWASRNDSQSLKMAWQNVFKIVFTQICFAK